jgi:hypothetical protein
VTPNSALVVSLRYQVTPVIQAEISHYYPAVVFRELAVKDGQVEVIASVPAGLHQPFLSHVLALGGSIAQADQLAHERSATTRINEAMIDSPTEPKQPSRLE